MSKFDAIRFFRDDEVAEALQQLVRHPMMKSLIQFTFPDSSEEELKEKIQSIDSIQSFQEEIAAKTVHQVLAKTSAGLSVSGIENLENDKPYLFISNHRDIILDTSLLNVTLLKYGKIMTASAIGDNLVQKPFLLNVAKINRNFIVNRKSSPRELLASSKLLSEYIEHLIKEEHRSVWIAQREGRTKDGNDQTHSGVLKMIGMAAEGSLLDYLQSLNIVPVSISYEYDPTDKLKMPQIMAQLNDEEYTKSKNEDFLNIMSGVMGTKRRIHLHIDPPISDKIEALKSQDLTSNKQIQSIAKIIDQAILANYKLWPTNYIAYDLLHKTDTFQSKYTEEEQKLFHRRLDMRVDKSQPIMVTKFLEMYANPVTNKQNL